MTFLLLALSALVLALLVRRRRADDPAELRSTLITAGIGFLLSKFLSTGIAGPGGPLGFPKTPLPIAVVLQGVCFAGAALLLWTMLSRLTFHRARRSDLFWSLPFAILSLSFAASAEVHPLVAAAFGFPMVLRARWRSDLSAGTAALVALVSFLFALLHFIQFHLHFPPAYDVAFSAEVTRFAAWVQSLAILYVFSFLPRLVWGMNVTIRSVKTRLFVSHLLTGLVPLALIFVFWGLSSYLSVNSERAAIAARQIDEECSKLAGLLEEALSASEEPAPRLAHWAGLQERAHPGLRVWYADSVWSRVHGPAIADEAILPSWPDSLAQCGVVVMRGVAYVGARRIERNGRAAAVLLPIQSLLGQNLFRRIGAEAYLETRFGFDESGHALADDSESLPFSARVEGSEGRAMGAALVSTIEWDGTSWREQQRLVWARVGFLDAVRGLASNLPENQFNWVPLLFLAGVAVLFVLVELVTVGMVVSMGRSITRSLDALFRGAARLSEGNLRYRIPIEGRDDLWDVADNFNLMAQELEKAREAEIERQRLEGELNVARQIQSRLMPVETPTVPRTELAGTSLPARQVGGDYYDYLPLPDGRVGVIVADVSGKGVPAALLMSSFRAALLSQRLEVHGPAGILDRLNRFLHRSIEPGRFVTAFLAVFDPETGRLVYSNAGHNPPYWIQANGGLATLREGGLVLGLFRETPYAEDEVTLGAGDLVAFFTDGVTEAQNEFEEFWGDDRFLEILRSHPGKSCRRVLAEILEEVRDFSGESGQTDDITLVLTRWRGPASLA